MAVSQMLVGAFLLNSSMCLLSPVHISDHQRSWPRPISHPPPRHASRWLPSCFHSHRRLASNETSKVPLHYHCLPPLYAAMLGWCLVGYLPDSQIGGRLGGVFIFAAYASGFPLSLSIIASDVAGYTKKTAVSAVVFLAYCAGNISGPQVFFGREAPHYRTGCEVCIICFVCVLESWISYC
jgi:hypothetical protein